MRVVRWRQFIKCKRSDNDIAERQYYKYSNMKHFKKYKHNGKEMTKFMKLIMSTDYGEVR